MNSDSYFEQGHSHQVCQDYAAHGESENFLYAVVSDGCSTSPDTDIGARILARSFVNGLERYVRTNRDLGNDLFEAKSLPDFGKMMQMQVLYSLPPIQQHMGLEDRAFNATLSAIVYSKINNKAYSFVWGDGLVYLRYTTWHLLHEFVYETNAPYYFSYFACRAEKQYEAEFGDNRATAITEQANLQGDVLGWEEIDREKVAPFYFAEIPTLDLELALVTSDGIGSYSRQSTVIPSRTILADIIAYKGYQGSFVRRRMNRILKENKKEGVEHYDDISVAAISFI